jgi:hypothetical protein
MRLRIILPKVTPDVIPVPTQCAYAGCRGSKVFLRQSMTKPLRDTVYHEVQVQCLRVQTHLPGVSAGNDPSSDRRLESRAWW